LHPFARQLVRTTNISTKEPLDDVDTEDIVNLESLLQSRQDLLLCNWCNSSWISFILHLLCIH